MISIIMPCEKDRLGLLSNTLIAYHSIYHYIQSDYTIQFIIPTRTIEENWFEEIGSMKCLDVKIVRYEHTGDSFNPSKALNLGVKNAKYDSIVITCPEIKPITNIIEQLTPLVGKNVLCQVFDESSPGIQSGSLVNSNYRSATPSMYFLAMFNKKYIQAINGWDEDFMKGYAYEDDDFGSRFVRSGLKFEMHDEIQAVHQWHPRGSLGGNDARHNCQLFESNKANNVIRPKNGLEKLE